MKPLPLVPNKRIDKPPKHCLGENLRFSTSYRLWLKLAWHTSAGCCRAASLCVAKIPHRTSSLRRVTSNKSGVNCLPTHAALVPCYRAYSDRPGAPCDSDLPMTSLLLGLPYFMAGVEAGLPLPSVDCCETPLLASDCPADCACASAPAGRDEIGLPYFSAADMRHPFPYAIPSAFAACGVSSKLLSSSDRFAKASVRPTS